MAAPEPPSSFFCPISQSPMRDPVTCADGHSYEKAEIERWLASHNTSPITGAVLASTTLTRNHALRNSIEEWFTTNFKHVPRHAVTFDEQPFAAGSSKTVHRGTLRGHSRPIAVLRMRDGGSCEVEAAKLVKLGRHEGLVRYLGMCTEGPEQLLLTELADYGSLDQFLEDRRDEVTLEHKLTMLRQICGAMIALSAVNMVHRDLAARNILVFAFDANDPAATVVKVTDFGLAVDRMYQTHASVQGAEVPFRWMPPEALRRRRFSEKSDVWAFGVTAWELLTNGEVPYAFIGSNEAVAERVCGGERLRRPGGCPDALWVLLQHAWAESPAARATFVEMAGTLATMEAYDTDDFEADAYDTDDFEADHDDNFRAPAAALQAAAAEAAQERAAREAAEAEAQQLRERMEAGALAAAEEAAKAEREARERAAAEVRAAEVRAAEERAAREAAEAAAAAAAEEQAARQRAEAEAQQLRERAAAEAKAKAEREARERAAAEAKAKAEMERRPTVGDCVEVTSDKHPGRCGKISRDDNDSQPYKVRPSKRHSHPRPPLID